MGVFWCRFLFDRVTLGLHMNPFPLSSRCLVRVTFKVLEKTLLYSTTIKGQICTVTEVRHRSTRHKNKKFLDTSSGQYSLFRR